MAEDAAPVAAAAAAVAHDPEETKKSNHVQRKRYFM